MLNKLRNFSKSRYSGVLVFVIIVPFVFWGMGSVFSGGNPNIIAKIDDESITSEQLVNSLNSKGIDLNYLKENIDNNIIQEALEELISITILKNEINKMNFAISDQSLIKKIKNDKNFLNEDKKFSRIKYEKFLIKNNLSAVNFEIRLKNQELEKKLFYYLSGGIKSPKFVIDKHYINDNKKITIDYINLKDNYKTKFSNKDIEEFVEKNKENLKKEYIDFSYTIIKPENLTNSNEFTEIFFEKIDEIENLIFDGKNINEIQNLYGLKLNTKLNYLLSENGNEIEDQIYKTRNKDKIKLIEKSDYYILYEIKNTTKKVPSINNEEFKKKILNNLKLEAKFDFNKNLNKRIQSNEFTDNDFVNLSSSDNKINKLKINSIKDINIFTTDSIKFIYTMPKNSFLIINDLKKNIYLAKIRNLELNNIDYSSENYFNYSRLSNLKIVNNLFNSYDKHLTSKYEVKIFDKNLERVIDYFK